LVPFSIGEYQDEVLCDVFSIDVYHLLLSRPWQYNRDVLHQGQSNTYSFKLKGTKLTLTPLSPNQTHKLESGRDKHKESALLVNRGRVKRAITKGKPVFAMLMMESAPNLDPTTLHPSVQPLIKEFENVLSHNVPPDLHLQRGIEHQIDLIPGAPLPNEPA